VTQAKTQPASNGGATRTTTRKPDSDFSRLLSLPAARNHGAEAASKAIPSIIKALPGTTDQERFANSLIVALNELNDVPNGDKCTDKSVLMCAYNCARLNLMPGRVLGLVAFIPRWNSKGGPDGKGATECQLMTMYRGYQEMAYRNGFLLRMSAQVVTQEELVNFDMWADEAGEHLKHRIDPNRNIEASNIVGAYCSFTRSNGTHGYVYVNRQQLDRAMQAGGDKGFSPWKDKIYFAAMARKTPIRAAAKDWLLTPDMALAVRMDEQIELGVPQSYDGWDGGGETDPDPAPRKPGLNDLPDPDAKAGSGKQKAKPNKQTAKSETKEPEPEQPYTDTGHEEAVAAQEQEKQQDQGTPSKADQLIDLMTSNCECNSDQAEAKLNKSLGLYGVKSLDDLSDEQFSDIAGRINSGDIAV